MCAFNFTCSNIKNKSHHKGGFYFPFGAASTALASENIDIAMFLFFGLKTCPQKCPQFYFCPSNLFIFLQKLLTALNERVCVFFDFGILQPIWTERHKDFRGGRVIACNQCATAIFISIIRHYAKLSNKIVLRKKIITICYSKLLGNKID